MIEQSKVPVIAWVGPSGGEAQGGATLLLQASHRAFVAQGASVGPGDPVRLDEPDDPPTAAVAAELAPARRSATAATPRARRGSATHKYSPAAGEGARRRRRRAARRSARSSSRWTARRSRPRAASVTLNTAKVIGEGRDRRRQPNQDVVFDGMGLGAQLQHGLIRPSVAYFLFVAGLVAHRLRVLRHQHRAGRARPARSRSIGACYGFSHLPVHWWAVGLLMLRVVRACRSTCRPVDSVRGR